MTRGNQLSDMENLFLALSDKTRLRLLNLMRKDEVCVNYLAEILQESQPKISRHLAYLRNAGIVSARRDGKWMHYRIVFPENKFVVYILQDILEWLENQEEMRQDYESLSKKYYLETSQNNNLQSSVIDILPEANMRKEDELDTFLL